MKATKACHPHSVGVTLLLGRAPFAPRRARVVRRLGKGDSYGVRPVESAGIYRQATPTESGANVLASYFAASYFAASLQAWRVRDNGAWISESVFKTPAKIITEEPVPTSEMLFFLAANQSSIFFRFALVCVAAHIG